MRRMFSFSGRTFKEITRDPLTLGFGLGFPLVLLLLLTIIQSNIPVSIFELTSLTPGVTVFGLSFVTLFAGQLVAKDRGTSFLQRLYTTPMKPMDFVLGYMLPFFPIAIGQALICYVAAWILGLQFSVNIIWSVLLILVPSLFYISLGLLCGSVLTETQVGGLCGALLTNLSAWLSGIWFDISMLGSVFEKIANLLPFIHAVEFERAVVAGNFSAALPHMLWVLGYGIAITALAVFAFLRQMKKQ